MGIFELNFRVFWISYIQLILLIIINRECTGYLPTEPSQALVSLDQNMDALGLTFRHLINKMTAH